MDLQEDATISAAVCADPAVSALWLILRLCFRDAALSAGLRVVGLRRSMAYSIFT